MDDFAEYLTSQAGTCGPALHEFILQYNDDDDSIHLFFEGDEDPSFYMPVVRRYAGSRALFRYVSGGKSALGAIKEYLVKNRYELGRVLFFADRDHDDLLGCQLPSDHQTFLTDFYSIESYLVGRVQAEIVLVDLAGVRSTDKQCMVFLDSIEARASEWRAALRPFMAYSLAAREAGLKPNMNNARLGDVFTVDGLSGTVRKKKGAFVAFKAALLRKDDVVEYADLLRWSRVLRHRDPRVWVRGKYLLWIFERALFGFLEIVIRRQKAAKQKAPKIPPSLREGRLLEGLGGRLPATHSLESFLFEALR